MSKEITIYYVKWYEWDYLHKEYFPLRSPDFFSFQRAKEQYDALECSDDKPQVEIHRAVVKGLVTLSIVRILMKEWMSNKVQETIGECEIL